MPSYSPSRRTVLVLTGTGAHGVYHAGALRALQEAGVKFDIVAGHGVGAGAAMLAAIDGGAKLSDASGLWRSDAAARMYGWRWPLRVAAWAGALLAAILVLPLLVLAAGLLVYLGRFLLEMLGLEAGRSLAAGYSAWLQTAFAGDGLPTTVPRLALLVSALMLLVLLAGGMLARWARRSRRAERGWWWRIVAAPVDAELARARFAGAIWDLIRGAVPVDRPADMALSRRYTEVLGENLGQPGFRELLLVATDLDARRDVVAAMLADGHRRSFLAPRAGRDRRTEVLDLSGVGRDHAIDVLRAALTPPVMCEPQLVPFAPDSYWRGETHRLCDRPGAVQRLLEEAAEAGATQAIVVSAIAPSASPHQLRPFRLDVRGRFGDFQAAAESAALRDAIETVGSRFESLFLIQPAHNPIGPFDLAGALDEASDRRQRLPELMEVAYEDAYRQFIEPVVGASGEQLAHVAAPEPDAAGDGLAQELHLR